MFERSAHIWNWILIVVEDNFRKKDFGNAAFVSEIAGGIEKLRKCHLFIQWIMLLSLLLFVFQLFRLLIKLLINKDNCGKAVLYGDNNKLFIRLLLVTHKSAEGKGSSGEDEGKDRKKGFFEGSFEGFPFWWFSNYLCPDMNSAKNFRSIKHNFGARIAVQFRFHWSQYRHTFSKLQHLRRHRFSATVSFASTIGFPIFIFFDF